MSNLHPLEISDLLANLVERSMILFDSETGRYRQTETIRAFASEELGPEQSLVREKHFDFFVEVAEKIAQFQRSWRDEIATSMFVRESDNLRAAAEWGFGHQGRSSKTLKLMGALGSCLLRVNSGEAKDHVLRALRDAPDGDSNDIAWAQFHLAMIKIRTRDLEGVESLFQNSLARFHEARYPAGLIMVHFGSSILADVQGDWERAKTLGMEALAVARESKLPIHESVALVNLGELVRNHGELEAAESYYHAALSLETFDFIRAIILYDLGSNALMQNEVRNAEQHFRALVAISGDITQLHGGPLANAVRAVGYLLVTQGNYRQGGLLLGYAEMMLERLGIVLDPSDAKLAERILELGRENGQERFLQALGDGHHMTVQRASEILSAWSSNC